MCIHFVRYCHIIHRYSSSFIVVPRHSRNSSPFNVIPHYSSLFHVILVMRRHLKSFLIIHRDSPSFNVFTHLYGIALHIIYVTRHLLSALHIIERRS